MSISMLNNKTNNEEFLSFIVDEIHNAVVSTVDGDLPSAQVVDLLLKKNGKIYITTSIRNHPFFDALNNAEKEDKIVLVNGYKGNGTMDSCGFSLKANIKNLKHEYIEEIFTKNPYLNTIYEKNIPKAKEILNVFELTPIRAGYLDHRVVPAYWREFLF